MAPTTTRRGAAIRFENGRLRVIDQTRLPGQEDWIELGGSADTAQAIRGLQVRGAPLIGVVAGYGLALAVIADPNSLERAWRELRTARPTAVNLAYAVDRVRAAALAAPSALEMGAAALHEAAAIHAREDDASDSIAAAGADLLSGCRRVLTHCNTGALATGGNGSALAIALELNARTPGLEVLVCETRPLLQGARLTVWELARASVKHALLVDGAAAGLLRTGAADAVIVGCDRVAANGDVANKVGTYALALAARAAGVPFVVAGPLSSIDAAVASGDDIEIEERSADEVRSAGGALLTLPGTPVRNPAFDVTPGDLVSALVTECGVVRAPDSQKIARLLAGSAAPQAR